MIVGGRKAAKVVVGCRCICVSCGDLVECHLLVRLLLCLPIHQHWYDVADGRGYDCAGDCVVFPGASID